MGREAIDPFPMVPLAKGQGLGDRDHELQRQDELRPGRRLRRDARPRRPGGRPATRRWPSWPRPREWTLSHRGAPAPAASILVGVREKVDRERAASAGLERRRQAPGALHRHRAGGGRRVRAASEAQIAKSLVFVADGDPVVCIASGAHRVDTDRWPTRSTWPRCARPPPTRSARPPASRSAACRPSGTTCPWWSTRHLLAHERVWAAGGDGHCLFDGRSGAAGGVHLGHGRGSRSGELIHGRPASAAARRAGADEPARSATSPATRGASRSSRPPRATRARHWWSSPSSPSPATRPRTCCSRPTSWMPPA